MTRWRRSTPRRRQFVPFTPALERVGGGLRRLADHRRQCRARLEQHLQQHLWHRGRRRLPVLAEYAGGLCARRRRHQLQRQRAGSGRSDLFQAGAFVRHNVGAAYISAALAYGWQDVTTNRTLTVAGATCCAPSSMPTPIRAASRAAIASSRRGWASRLTRPDSSPPSICRPMPSSALSGASIFALAYGAKSVTDPRSELGLRSDKSFALPDAHPDPARPRRLGA